MKKRWKILLVCVVVLAAIAASNSPSTMKPVSIIVKPMYRNPHAISTVSTATTAIADQTMTRSNTGYPLRRSIRSAQNMQKTFNGTEISISGWYGITSVNSTLAPRL